MNNRILIATLLLTFTFATSLPAKPYTRVIALAQSISENIYQLQAQEMLVGCTSYCTPAMNDGVEVVATSITINIEKVLSLKPDLILATGITSPDNIELLRKFGIKVQVFETPRSFEEICAQFSEMGSLLGKEKYAQNFIAEKKAGVDSIKNISNKNPKEKIFFQIGADPLFTVIPNTFMDDYIQKLNGTNIAAELKHGTISREKVLQSMPDKIFIVTMGILGDQQKEQWMNYKNLPAVNSNNIYIIDANLACTPTPETFLRTLEIMHSSTNQ